MIKKIDKHILSSFLGPLLITTVIGDFILLMQFFWVYVDELVGKGLEWYIIAELMFYAAATFIPMALPIGVLLASLMTFGKLGEYYELIALKSAGVSLRRILTPVATLAVGISMLSVYYCNSVLPKANIKFTSIFYDIRQQKLAFNITEGVFYKDIDGYVLKVDKKDDDDRTLYGIMVYDHTEGKGNDNITFAEKGIMEIVNNGANLKLTLFDGYNYNDAFSIKNKNELPFRRISFSKEIMLFDLSQFDLSRTDEHIRGKSYRDYNFKQLKHAVDTLSKGRADVIATNYYKQKMAVPDNMQRFRDYYYTTPMDSIKALVADLPDSLSVCDKHREVINKALGRAKDERQKSSFYGNHISYVDSQIRINSVEYHRRFALAVAVIVLFFIGAPLGSIIRKGGLGMPLVLATLIFVLYYIILTVGQKAALRGELSPWLGMWIANIVVLPFGAFLTYKATYDSKMLDRDSWWHKIIKMKIFNVNKNN